LNAQRLGSRLYLARHLDDIARQLREREMNTALVFERRLDRIAVAF
jgi:hypothetical protein